MNVVVFASRKGGSGKSTLAAHLAAQVHKSVRPCLLVDADPQGSLTLWHKLRGTNEPPLKTAVRSVSEIVARQSVMVSSGCSSIRRQTLSAVVDDAIRNATMVIIPARPGVFDVNAVQDTIQICRTARKPYAVIINGAPARRDECREPHRGDCTRKPGQVQGAGVGWSDHQPCGPASRSRRRRRRARI